MFCALCNFLRMKQIFVQYFAYSVYPKTEETELLMARMIVPNSPDKPRSASKNSVLIDATIASLILVSFQNGIISLANISSSTV